MGVAMLYLSVIVLIPLAAVAVKALGQSPSAFWQSVTNATVLRALAVTLVASLLVALIGGVMGTIVAWVLVRDEFPGKRIVNALIDLPFALPTIVAGLTLLALYGPDSPFGIHIAYTRGVVVVALLFVTLPFVVRSVQPVLLELDSEVEEAAASLGASNWITFRRVIFPALRPAILSGAALSFARSVGEIGSLVLILGKVQIASIVIFADIESDAPRAAASLSLVLIVLSLLVLVAIRRLGGRVGEAG
jgi:sulfate transport system permease protein